MDTNEIDQQRALCARFGVKWFGSPFGRMVGISRTVVDDVWPLHGMRIPPEAGTTGWFIWAGELSDDPDFFEPMHVEHLPARCPLVVKYLGLPPGWRFLADGVREDVWSDPALLEQPGH